MKKLTSINLLLVLACIFNQPAVSLYAEEKQSIQEVQDDKQEKHLFIFSGQSNMSRFKPDKVFQPIVEREFGKGNVVIVKDARGGKPIRRWYRNWKSADGETPREPNGDLYDSLKAKIDKALRNQKVDTVTFIWMQGEADAKEKHGEVYLASLKGLVDQLCNDLERQEINVICGRLSDHGLKKPHWVMIREAQVQFAESLARGAWVNTDDLNDGPDGQGRVRHNALHYSVEGYKILGKRYAEKAIALIRNE